MNKDQRKNKKDKKIKIKFIYEYCKSGDFLLFEVLEKILPKEIIRNRLTERFKKQE